MPERDHLLPSDQRYRSLIGIDRPALMWEWLRRDPAYISWYARMSDVTRGDAPDDIDPIRWGLHFRGVAKPSNTRCQDPVGRCHGSRHVAGNRHSNRLD